MNGDALHHESGERPSPFVLDVLALDDQQFEAQFRSVPQIDIDALHGEVREKWFRRVRKATGYIGTASSRIERGNGGAGVLSVLSPDDPYGWLEPKPIKSELYAVEPLREEIIPEPFRAWIYDISERMQCPADFVAATAIVMTGAIIGAGCGVRPKQKDDWAVIPNLWGGVVGRPSMLKSPAMQEAMKPLARLEIEAKKEYDDAKREHDAEVAGFKASQSAITDDMRSIAKNKDHAASSDMAAAKTRLAKLIQPPPPLWKRFKTNDATIERMGELLSENPRGLLLFRDELIGLLATWDKEGHETDRAFYLEAWNGYGSNTTDRIGRGTVFTENLCVSVFGGIPPAKLVRYLYGAMRGADNDGLVQRIQLLVYPDEPPSWSLVDRYPNTGEKSRAFEVIRKLVSIEFTQYGAVKDEQEKIPFFRFDAQAQELFYEWLTELETQKLRGDYETIMVEHLGKYRKLMPALALIFHAIEIADDKVSGPITLRSAQRAAAWCEYLESHARRIYGMVSNLGPRAAVKLSERIKSGEGTVPNRFTVRDIYRKGWELLSDKEVVQDACEILVAHGWISEVPAVSEMGRPPSPTYVVNPKARGA